MPCRTTGMSDGFCVKKKANDLWTGAVVYQGYSYEILSVYLCCTVGAPMLHLWCQGVALLLELLFKSLYSGFSVGQIRQISWSTDYNSYANMFFSNTNRTNLTNLVGCDPVYIRGIREIRGQEPAASGNACKSV